MFSLKFSLRVNIQAGCGKTPGHWRVRRTDGDLRGVGFRATGRGQGGPLSDISNAARLSPNLVCPDPSNAPRRWAGKELFTPLVDEET